MKYVDTINYIIMYNYDTGDTFGIRCDIEEELDKWKNSNIAEENLLRIREHYLYYLAINKHWFLEDKDEQTRRINESKSKPWFVKKYDGCINLLTDNGDNYQIGAPWCGYFEKLNRVWIEEDNPKRNCEF